MTKEPPRGPAASTPGSHTDDDVTTCDHVGNERAGDEHAADGHVGENLVGGDHLSAGLTVRRDNFCRAYVLDPNGTRAAVNAGYSPPTARQQGSRLLTNVNIQNRIRSLRADIAERHCLDAGSLMGKLEAVYLRAFEHYQMHACVRAIGLQAQLAGALPTAPDKGSHAVAPMTPPKAPAAASLTLVPASGASTPADDPVTLGKD